MSKETEFELEKMKRFFKKEAMVRFAVKDLSNRMPNEDEEFIFRVVYNSYVADDSAMLEAYKKS